MKNKVNPIIKIKVKTLWFLFVLFVIQVSFSQNNKRYYIPDSLKNKTYKELYEKEKLYWNDSVKAKIYALAYLHKAKNKKDTVRIAHGYSQLGSMSYYKNAIKYYDSIILLTKDFKNNPYYPSYAYMVKGISFYQIGDYQKSLDNYLLANQYANDSTNIRDLLYIKDGIASIKNLWGNHREAIDIYKDILIEIDSIKDNSVYLKSLYYESLYVISNSYTRINKLDSAMYYAKKGLKESLVNNDSIFYYNFVSQTGEILYFENDYKKAIDSLNKALPHETSSSGFLNYHYYRGSIYWKKNNEQKAFYHFKKADSIYDSTKDIVPEIQDIQEFFVSYYKKNNDIDNQLKHINKLLYVDSIINNYRKNLNENIIKKYDTPKLVAEKEKLIHQLQNKGKKSSYLILLLIGLIALAIIFIVYSNKRKRIYKQRFQELLNNNSKKETSHTKKANDALTGISKNLISAILLELDEFEKNNLYIDNNLSLNSLSKALKTNPNYLSKIINHYKEKSFNNYISDLRIDYCVAKLKTDLKFRKYGVKSIAAEIGFNNTESFSKAFYKKTGIYPSYFIKNLDS